MPHSANYNLIDPSPLTSLVDLFNLYPPFAFKTTMFSPFSGLGIVVALEHLTGRSPHVA